mmetsp:Transcript_12104/g.27688  ORF Transcript_12104/g.27688 Transcript_12104/m.27688 type:complete len:214 (-) Transcript_12104:56-697(-)
MLSLAAAAFLACTSSPGLAYRMSDLQSALTRGGGEDLPYCKEVAPDSYPGFCDPSVSDKACYHTSKSIGVVDVHWACSAKEDPDAITQESCAGRGWTYRGPPNDKHQTKKGKTHMVVFKQEKFYEGACRFGAAKADSSPMVSFAKVDGNQEQTSSTATTVSSSNAKDEKSSSLTTAEKSTNTVTTTHSAGAGLAPSLVGIALSVLLTLPGFHM